MNRQIAFPLEKGGTLLVEVDEPEPEIGLQRAGNVADVIEKAQRTLESTLDNIKPAAATIISKLRELADSPDEITVEFGIKLTAEANVVLSKAAVEGNYKICLKWQKNEKAAP